MTAKLGLSAVMVFALSAILTPDAAAQGRRGGGMMGGRGLGSLLSNEGVQKELKLDSDQTTKANELAAKAREKMQESFQSLQGLEAAERRQKSQDLNRELNASIKKDASEFLKADQLARLVQIDYQNRGAAVYSDPEVQSKLKITDDQKAAIKEIQEESAQAMGALFSGGGGGNREEAMAKFRELQNSTKEKIEGKLTDDQKKAWKELVGAPFEVRFAPRQRGGNN